MSETRQPARGPLDISRQGNWALFGKRVSPKDTLQLTNFQAIEDHKRILQEPVSNLKYLSVNV